MSVGSFAGYAPVFWAYGLNGFIIDHNKPVAAYTKIFMIGVVVSLCGVVASFILMMVNKKKDKANYEARKAARAKKAAGSDAE